jgi:hypothetical protein
VAYPELMAAARDDPHAVFIGDGATTPLSFLVTFDSFDTLAAKFPECDLMISLIGLPAELEAVQCWHTPGKPAFALLLPDLQLIGVAEIRRAVKEGKLVAFVLNKPGAVDSRNPVSRDWKAEFDKRYLLVTAENIEETISSYPQLFRVSRDHQSD